MILFTWGAPFPSENTMMENGNETERVLRRHAERYAAMRPRDAVKLLYQSEFGGGHFVGDERRSMERLEREYSSLEKREGVPLFEYIGDGTVRINLAAVNESDLPQVNTAFVESANLRSGNISGLLDKLEVLKTLAREGVFAFSAEELDSYLKEYADAGYPAVSHSDEYRLAYAPAYRVAEYGRLGSLRRQRVLDIDLDFFLAECCMLAKEGERPPLEGHEPWSGEEVIKFLENNCGLSKKRPIPGRIFQTHDGALGLWDELIKDGRLGKPFDVTHIDAHSDLGIGKPGPRFVLENVLSVHPEKRAELQRYYDCVQLDEANYLLFALAFRWIARLENVRNKRSRPDIPQQIAQRDENGRYSSLLLRSGVSAIMEKFNGKEPRVDFEVYDDWERFDAFLPYDFMSVAVSPRYAPKEADALLEIFEDYMIKI